MNCAFSGLYDSRNLYCNLGNSIDKVGSPRNTITLCCPRHGYYNVLINCDVVCSDTICCERLPLLFWVNRVSQGSCNFTSNKCIVDLYAVSPFDSLRQRHIHCLSRAYPCQDFFNGRFRHVVYCYPNHKRLTVSLLAEETVKYSKAPYLDRP